MITALLKYPGGKWRIADWIISHFPPHKVYLEPFFGGGGVFFRKEPSYLETINDISGDIVNLFRVCRESPEDLARALEFTPWSREEYRNCYEIEGDEIERARRTLVRHHQSFGTTNSNLNTWRNSQTYNSPRCAAQWNQLPETVYYIRHKFKEWEEQGIPCKIYYPTINFWSLCLKKKMLPQRQTRFCCAELKERNDIPELQYAVRSFGVRKAESVRRSLHRDSIETRSREDYKDIQRFHFDNTDDVRQTGACYTNSYFFVNPIAYWSAAYLWDYIGGERLETNPLYKEGFNRVGCMCCPMAGVCDRKRELAKYPKYEKRFIRLADDIIQIRNAQGLPNKYNYKTGAEYFDMWLNNTKLTASEEGSLFEYE